MSQLYKQIISRKNIELAYFDLVKRLDEKCKSSKVVGADGLCINDFNYNSKQKIDCIQFELIHKKPVQPVLFKDIPKKSGGKRRIFIYSVFDRIKAQAIYRVISPFVNNYLSNYSFCYRSTHPTYYAIRSIIRRYHKRFGKDFLLLSDFKQYTDFIDREILISKLKKIGFANDLIDLLKIFIFVDQFSERSNSKEVGLIQGTPLIALFANIFLDDLDKFIGPKVQLYRRVGDDLIACDPSKEKLEKIKTAIIEFSKKNKLVIKESKTKLICSSNKFDFLGYNFDSNIISIPEKSVKRRLNFWENELKKSRGNIKKMKEILFLKDNCIYDDIVNFLMQFNLAENEKQMKSISNKFFHIFIRILHKKVSSRNRKKFFKNLSEFKIPSIFKIFLNLRHGKITFSELSALKKTYY